jgi:hypothetical protein
MRKNLQSIIIGRILNGDATFLYPKKSSKILRPNIYKIRFTGSLGLTLFYSASSNYILLYQRIYFLAKEKKQIYFLRSDIYNIQTR